MKEPVIERTGRHLGRHLTSTCVPNNIRMRIHIHTLVICIQRKTTLRKQVCTVFIIPTHSLNIQLLLPYNPLKSFKREKNVTQCWHCLPGDVRNGVRVPQGFPGSRPGGIGSLYCLLHACSWMDALPDGFLVLAVLLGARKGLSCSTRENGPGPRLGSTVELTL